MKNSILFLLIIIGTISASGSEFPSSVSSVHLYQDQALVTRQARITLKKGINTVTLTGLPRGMNDSSVRAGLPEYFNGTLLSVEVEKNPLLTERRKEIISIEEKLETLRNRDRELMDKLKIIDRQEQFLDSLSEFHAKKSGDDIIKGQVSTGAWEKTLNYTARKSASLKTSKRSVIKKRKKLGEEIQKHEFRLRQLTGEPYFRYYNSINQDRKKKSSQYALQEYSASVDAYREKQNFLYNPVGKVDYEKRIILRIHSRSDQTISLNVEYLIKGTSWDMTYTLRADHAGRKVELSVNGEIFQKTGENWNNIRISLSTGTPSYTLNPPSLPPWYVTVRENIGRMKKSGYPQKMEQRMDDVSQQELKKERSPAFSRHGSRVEISFPHPITVISSKRKQKKKIQSYTLSGTDIEKFYYEALAGVSESSYLTVQLKNGTDLPWLQGKAQVFLSGEYTGSLTIPFTPQGQKQTLVLSSEPSLSVTKTLIKRFEDSPGVFDKKKRISYSFLLEVKNGLDHTAPIELKDRFPVSRNEKVEIEVIDLSEPFAKGETDSADYHSGMRLWRFNLAAGATRKITYRVTITFPKDINIEGLR